MSNIIKCPKCNRSLINEEFLSHSCQVVIKDIKYKWFVKTETDNYGEVIIIETIDGTLYRISPVLPPKNKHPFSTPRDETEPNFTLFIISTANKSQNQLSTRF